MDKRLILMMVATACLAVGTASTAGPQAGPRDIADPEAYAVYASLLPQEWTIRVARAKRLVMLRESATYKGCLPSGGVMETDWLPVVESYKAENATTRYLLPGRDLGRPYIVVPTQEVMELFKKAPNDGQFGWTPFYERYPDSGGYMEVSAVGFDPSKTRALAYIAHHCGGLCGGGEHYLLQKRDRQWRPVTLRGVTGCVWRS